MTTSKSLHDRDSVNSPQYPGTYNVILQCIFNQSLKFALFYTTSVIADAKLSLDNAGYQVGAFVY